MSFLVPSAEFRRLLEQAGFKIIHWRDTTEAGRQWYRRVADKIQREGLPPLGFHVLMGHHFREMAENQRRNLDEDRIALIELIARRD